MPRGDSVRVDCEIKFETARAVLIIVDAGNGTPREVWVPLSTVHEMHRSKTPGETYIVIEQWFANKESLA